MFLLNTKVKMQSMLLFTGFEASGILSSAVATPLAIGEILLSVELRRTFIFNLPLRKALPKYHLIKK